MIQKLRRHIEEIIALTDDEFSTISSYFILRNFKKGEFLIRQGTKVPETFFVVSGLLKLTSIDESGKEHILSFAMEDWWETDYLAFNTNTNARMSLQCLEDSSILRISLKNYYKPLPIAEATFTDPVYSWDQTVAPTGLTFYAGHEFPTWKNNLIVPGLSKGSLWRIVVDGDKIISTEELFINSRERLRKAIVSPGGRLYLLSDTENGKLNRVSNLKHQNE